MLLNRKGQPDMQRALLYLLTGDQTVLPPLAKRGKVKTTVPTFISSWKPEVLQDKSRAGGKGPANPGMNESRAWGKHKRDNDYKSRSGDIQDHAKSANRNIPNRMLVMSNKQKENPVSYRQSPCHRDMTAGEQNSNPHPNVGPDTR